MYLVRDQFDHFWVIMTQGVDGDASCEVQVLTVFEVP
jgi:hypothetical protein